MFPISHGRTCCGCRKVLEIAQDVKAIIGVGIHILGCTKHFQVLVLVVWVVKMLQLPASSLRLQQILKDEKDCCILSMPFLNSNLVFSCQ